jgi:hypothetical protein
MGHMTGCVMLSGLDHGLRQCHQEFDKKKKSKKKHQTHGMSGKESDLDGSLSPQL